MEDNERRFLNPPIPLGFEPFLRSVAVTTTTAVATASTAARAAVAASAATTPGPLFPGPGDVNGQGATSHIFAIQPVDGFLRLFRCAHGHEGETSRASGHPVGDEIGFDNGSVGGKGILEVVFSDFKVEVPDE